MNRDDNFNFSYVAFIVRVLKLLLTGDVLCGTECPFTASSTSGAALFSDTVVGKRTKDKNYDRSYLEAFHAICAR